MILRATLQNRLGVLRNKWRKKGYSVDVTIDQYCSLYYHSDCCGICNKHLGEERHVVVRPIITEPTIITIDLLTCAHKNCRCRRCKEQ